MPTNLAAAERVLKAVKSGEVPHREDALKLRMLMPVDMRTARLEEIAEAIIETEKQHRKAPSTEN